MNFWMGMLIGFILGSEEKPRKPEPKSEPKQLDAEEQFLRHLEDTDSEADWL